MQFTLGSTDFTKIIKGSISEEDAAQSTRKNSQQTQRVNKPEQSKMAERQQRKSMKDVFYILQERKMDYKLPQYAVYRTKKKIAQLESILNTIKTSMTTQTTQNQSSSITPPSKQRVSNECTISQPATERGRQDSLSNRLNEEQSGDLEQHFLRLLYESKKIPYASRLKIKNRRDLHHAALKLLHKRSPV